MAYGVTMMVGTLGVLAYGWHSGMGERAITMAFTTFVLFQVFNVFNARSERGSAFNRRFFDNRMLWVSLVVVVALQAVAVHWAPAQEIFGTTAMTARDWGITVGVASLILLLEETRKLIERFARYCRTKFEPS
jgi:Ca2+-transporting ATPase